MDRDDSEKTVAYIGTLNSETVVLRFEQCYRSISRQKGVSPKIDRVKLITQLSRRAGRDHERAFRLRRYLHQLKIRQLVERYRQAYPNEDPYDDPAVTA